jgi:cation diffusion facilitator family transporter
VKTTPEFEFPPKQQAAVGRARRLAWITIAYTASVVVVMYLAMGSSQAMKTAWLEDVRSNTPSIVFLIAARIAIWPPSERFPYGFHRVVSIAFLAASLALFVMGSWLLVESVNKLVRQEHPTIGGVHAFGRTFWLGWLMLPALVWSAIPAMILGRKKQPLAETIHDKVLHTDAQMQKASWLTALAAIAGVVGIGYGYWWADAVAAGLISADVIHDGFKNLKQVICDLMDERPMTVAHSRVDELPDRMRRRLKSFPWVQDAAVRMREQGHVYFGEAFVVVSDETDLTAKLRRAVEDCVNLDWRIHDLVITSVHSLEDQNRNGDESRPSSQ